MLLPLDSHFTQAERFRAQADATQPMKKRIWQEIVRAKLEMQARVLLLLHGATPGCRNSRVGRARGTPTTSRRRQPNAIGPCFSEDTAFRRGNEQDKRNAMLNYGYAVLRAVTARAICASGLHPSFGVNHRNRYNAFCLADDLMEPRVRSWIIAWRTFAGVGRRERGLNKTAKLTLLDRGRPVREQRRAAHPVRCHCAPGREPGGGLHGRETELGPWGNRN